MADNKRAPHSLKRQSADQIRNEQRGGDATPIDPRSDGGIEGNATMRKVWSEPGGEAYNYRQARTGETSRAGAEGHDELTAAETPETTKHLSDATLSPDDKDATAEAIARAGQTGGGSMRQERPGNRADDPMKEAGHAASHLGQGNPETKAGSKETPQRRPSANPPRQPGDIASGLQPGGSSPGGGPGGGRPAAGAGAVKKSGA